MKLSIALSLLAAAGPASASGTGSSFSGAIPSSDDCTDPGTERGPYGVGFSDSISSLSNPNAPFGPQFVPAATDRILPGLNLTAFGVPSIITGADDAITYEVFYPIDDTAPGTTQYVVIPDPNSPQTLTIPAKAGQPLSSAEGCWPLAIYSHGTGSFPGDSYRLVTRLASYGYVVFAPTHTGNSLFEFLLDPVGSQAPAVLDAVAHDRPRDIKSVLDAAVSLSGLTICDGQIAALGVSFGAFTALAAANGFTSPVPTVGDTFPADTRIEAVVSMASSTTRFKGNAVNPYAPFRGNDILTDLQGTTKRTMVLSAEFDERTPLDTNTDPLWDTIKCSTEETYRADLAGAGHDSFTSGCDIIDQQINVIFGLFLRLGVFDLSSIVVPTPDDIALVCSDLTNPAFADLATTCQLYFGLLPTKVSAGCMVGVEICPNNTPGDIFEDIATLLTTIDPNVCGLSPDQWDSLELYVCSALGVLVYGSNSLITTDCANIQQPTLTGDEAQEITYNLVVSYLERVFERSDCYKDNLEDRTALASFSLVPETLFLDDGADKLCT